MAAISTAMFWWSMAITAITSAVSINAQQKNAKAQLEYQKQVQEQTEESAKQSQIDQTKQLNLGLIQEQTATADEAASINKEKLKAIGRGRTAAGESGVSGVSLENLMADFNRQESSYIDSLKYNTEMSAEKMNANAMGVHAKAGSRINIARGKPVSRPDIYSEALSIGGKALDHGSRYLGWGKRLIFKQ